MAAFVSYTSGAASRSVTVPSGSDRLLVVVCLNSTEDGTTRTVTYDGVALDLALASNDWVQIHYMLEPPVGSATLSVSGGGLSTVLAVHYTGVGSFQAGSGEFASAASLSLDPSGPGVAIVGFIAVSTAHTALSGTTERHDADGEWYGDRVVSGAGTVTVGASSATTVDIGGCVFLDPLVEVDASGTATAPAPTASGTATVEVAAAGAVTAPVPTATGTATVTVSASGTATAPAPTASGTATVEVAASGAVTAPTPTATGTATVEVAASGTATAPAPTATGTATVEVAASGTATAPAPTATGEVTADPLGTPVDGAVDAPAATATGSATVEVAASGAPDAPAPTATGAATIEVVASGAVAAPLATAAGSATVEPFPTVEVSGTVTAPTATAAGAVALSGTAQPVAGARVSRARATVTITDPLARTSRRRPRATATED